MKLWSAIRTQKCGVAMVVWLILANTQSLAQWVEVSLRIESSFYPLKPSGRQTEHRNTYTARCIFGSNTWSIEGEFSSNARQTWWCTGTNIIEHTVITKEIPEERMQKLRTEFAIIPLPVGHRHTAIHQPWEKQPLVGMANLTWLAFCSGSFLKSDGRRIQPPYPTGNGRQCRDKTKTFDDPLGLPAQIELYTRDMGPLLCRYEVVQSTNFLGWTVPTRFEFTQFRTTGGGTSQLSRRISATTTSMRKGSEPVVPPEVLNDSEDWKRVKPDPNAAKTRNLHD